MEFLVCEVRPLFLESRQYEAGVVEGRLSLPRPVKPAGDFRVELNEWCDQDHDENDTFFGLKEPYPCHQSYPVRRDARSHHQPGASVLSRLRRPSP